MKINSKKNIIILALICIYLLTLQLIDIITPKVAMIRDNKLF